MCANLASSYEFCSYSYRDDYTLLFRLSYGEGMLLLIGFWYP